MLALAQATFFKFVGGDYCPDSGVAALPLPQMMLALAQATFFKFVGEGLLP